MQLQLSEQSAPGNPENPDNHQTTERSALYRNNPYLKSDLAKKIGEPNSSITAADLTRISYLSIFDIVVKFSYGIYRSQHPHRRYSNSHTCHLVKDMTSLLFIVSKLYSLMIMIFALSASIKKNLNQLRQFISYFRLYCCFELGMVFMLNIEILGFDCQEVKKSKIIRLTFLYFFGGCVAIWVYYTVWMLLVDKAIKYLDVGGWGRGSTLSIATPKSYDTFDKAEEERERAEIMVRRRKELLRRELEKEGKVVRGTEDKDLLESLVLDPFFKE